METSPSCQMSSRVSNVMFYVLHKKTLEAVAEARIPSAFPSETCGSWISLCGKEANLRVFPQPLSQLKEGTAPVDMPSLFKSGRTAETRRKNASAPTRAHTHTHRTDDTLEINFTCPVSCLPEIMARLPFVRWTNHVYCCCCLWHVPW